MRFTKFWFNMNHISIKLTLPYKLYSSSFKFFEHHEPKTSATKTSTPLHQEKPPLLLVPNVQSLPMTNTICTLSYLFQNLMEKIHMVGSIKRSNTLTSTVYRKSNMFTWPLSILKVLPCSDIVGWPNFEDCYNMGRTNQSNSSSFQSNKFWRSLRSFSSVVTNDYSQPRY